jgi:hypothetical protein
VDFRLEIADPKGSPMRVSKIVLVPAADAVTLEAIKSRQERWVNVTEAVYALGGVWAVVFGLFTWVAVASDDAWSTLPWVASPGAVVAALGGVIVWRRRKLGAARRALREKAVEFVINDEALNRRKADMRKLVNEALDRYSTSEQEQTLLNAYNRAAEELQYQDIAALDGNAPDLQHFEELVNALRVAADHVKATDERASL